MRGATVERVHDALKKENGTKKRKKIVLVVGTNDCSNDDHMDDIVSKYSSLIDTSRSLATEVVVSGVCPRLDSTEVAERCQALNAGLESVAEEKDCEFVDHSPSFTLADGSVNEGFLIGKGPHLTRSGTNRLTRNLKLSKVGDDITKAYSKKIQRPQHLERRNTTNSGT